MLTISQTMMRHESGTKFYEVTRVSNQKRALLITRWGRVKFEDVGGQSKVVRVYSNYYESVIRLKQGRGYVKAVEEDLSISLKDALKSLSKSFGNRRLDALRRIDTGHGPNLIDTFGEDEEYFSSSPRESPLESPVIRGEEWGSW